MHIIMLKQLLHRLKHKEAVNQNTTVGDTRMSEFVEQGQEEVSNEASAAEARAWLQANPQLVPEGVSVGARGRLSAAARQAFEQNTGRSVK